MAEFSGLLLFEMLIGDGFGLEKSVEVLSLDVVALIEANGGGFLADKVERNVFAVTFAHLVVRLKHQLRAVRMRVFHNVHLLTANPYLI